MLFIHIIFVLLSFISFVARVALSEFKPEILTAKIFKIAPHVIDTLLLLSGITLVFNGNWIASGNYGWIISKFMVFGLYWLRCVHHAFHRCETLGGFCWSIGVLWLYFIGGDY